MTDEPREEGPETTQLPPPNTDPSARAYSQVPTDAPYGSTASFDSPSDAFSAVPPTGPQPAVVAKAPGRRHLGKIIALVSIAVILLVVIAGVGTELYLRHKVKDCVAQGVSDFTGSDVDVSLSGKPVILQAVTGDIPYVQVDTRDKAGATDTTRLHMRLDELSSKNDTSTIGRVTGNGFVSFSRVQAMSTTAQGQTEGQTGGDTGGSGLTSLKGNEADGTIDVDATVTALIFPIPVSVKLKPEVANGKLSFKVVDAKAASFVDIPDNYAQGIVDQISKSMFGDTFDSLTFASVKVAADGVNFDVTGENLQLKENVSSPNGSCSALF